MSGLREQKKQATRDALGAAALRLALERGPESVRVDDIAEAAGVSPRTYNNYFPSREHAIVAAVVADRASRVAAAVVARPAEVGLAEAVVEAVVEQYTDPGDGAREALLMITGSPALRARYVETAAAIEGPLAEAMVERRPDMDPSAAEILAAAAGTAVKIALRQWLQPTSTPGLVVVSGSLPDRLRTALSPLRPALDAA